MSFRTAIIIPLSLETLIGACHSIHAYIDELQRQKLHYFFVKIEKGTYEESQNSRARSPAPAHINERRRPWHQQNGVGSGLGLSRLVGGRSLVVEELYQLFIRQVSEVRVKRAHCETTLARLVENDHVIDQRA